MAFFKKSPPEPPPRTVIAKGTRFQGDLITPADVHIEGSLEGTVNTAATLYLEVGGRLTGSCRCGFLEWNGSGTCDLEVTGLASFGSRAVWEGRLTAGRLASVKGARLQGRFSAPSPR